MKILVTGGAGYIGSHAVRELLSSGHEVIVLDDLSKGHSEAVDPGAQLIVGSTSDAKLLKKIFDYNQVEAVMHFAANIEVGESVTDPYKYYDNNFVNSLALLRAIVEAGILKFVFSSTAAVYGNPEAIPIREGQTRHPINPYGRSKMMVEMAIEDFCHAHGLGYTILRYFNVAGASPDFMIGEDHSPESHLIPRILQTANGGSSEVQIFGTDYPTNDGTCIRDYVHVVDLVRAHVLAIEALIVGKGSVYNVGSETGFSVLEVIEACRRVTGRPIIVNREGRRAGDPPILVASSQKLRKELKWEPIYPSIETIVQHAWRWHASHPQGYRTKLPPESYLSGPFKTYDSTSGAL